MLLIRDQMMKKMKKEKNKKKILKILSFAKEIQQIGKEELRNSLYIRKIKGCREPIFKFRLNTNERVLFMFGSDIEDLREEYKNAIVLIDYCNHDSQILKARRIESINANNISEEDLKIEIWTSEDEFDNEIDALYKNYRFCVNQEMNIVISDQFMKYLIEDDSEEYLYYLNDEQYECLKNSTLATIVKGSAGSGKTTILLHKLGMLAGDKLKVGYFTYTSYLRDRAENIYSKYWKYDKSKIYFYSLIDFLLRTTGISMDRVVTLNKFKQWYINTVGRFYKFHYIDVWTEIKGIIKGCMGINWIRDRAILVEFLDVRITEFFEKKGYIKKHSGRWILHTQKSLNEIKEELYREGYKDEREIIVIENLKKYFYRHHNLIDTTKSGLDEEYYLELPEDYSIFSYEDRKEIYQIYLKYNEWLKESNLFDEDDLALIVIEKIKKNEIEKFDFLLVDEIQDLSEVEIYALFNLVKNKENIIAAGDVHQIINPTFFSFGRVANYFSCIDVNFKEFCLKKNYRSQEQIVELANKMCEFRKKYIGALSDDILEVSIRSGEKPWIVPLDKDNLEKAVEFVSTNKSSVLIVEDEDTKNKIASKYNILEKIFTVHEAKGLEFNYVICINLISKHEDVWTDILSGLAKRISKYRYFFNLFYVAITRCKRWLIIMEGNPYIDIIEALKGYIWYSEVLEIDEKMLEISSIEERYQYARMLEQKELLKEAISAYEKLGSEKDVLRCRIKLQAEATGYETAGDRLLEIEEFEEAAKYYFKALCYEKMIKAKILAGNYIDREDILKEDMNEYNITWSGLLSKFDNREIIQLYHKYFRGKCEKIKNLFNDIDFYIDYSAEMLKMLEGGE